MTTKKATKKAPKSNKVYVITVEDYSDEGFNGETYVLGTYKSLAKAKERACAEVEQVLDEIYCEHAYFEGIDEEFSWGNWDELPETNEEKDEDEANYSQEEILDLVEKAGGQVRIEVNYDNYYEITITEQEVRG